MEQITVPQFLDVEDKVFGPITVRQFAEIIVGGLLIFVFYRIFDFSLFIVSSLIIVAVVVLFAFVKIGGQSFHYFVLNFYQTFKNPKFKVWRKDISIEDVLMLSRANTGKKAIVKQKINRAPVTSSRLSELSLIVDTGGVYQGENE
ncbi:MAG: PrgI family protein [Patescibacteria group bacterium]